MPFKASAPGSLMLLGEHAVLYGKPALVCAVDQRITVTLTPRDDDQITIQSDLYGNYDGCLSFEEPSTKNPFRFILAVLNHSQLPIGCHLHIQSDFSDQIGLGSSAAVTVATLAAVKCWLNQSLKPLDLIEQGRQIIRQVQGVGSGADVAAAVLGGLVNYQIEPLLAETFPDLIDLTVLYAGYKTPTVDVIHQVQSQFSSNPILFEALINKIGQCASSGIECVRQKEWESLGKIMNLQQNLMKELGVSTEQLSTMVNDLNLQSLIHGAKISGSGLGDCVVGLGKVPDDYQSPQGEKRISVNMSLQGVNCEKI